MIKGKVNMPLSVFVLFPATVLIPVLLWKYTPRGSSFSVKIISLLSIPVFISAVLTMNRTIESGGYRWGLFVLDNHTYPAVFVCWFLGLIFFLIKMRRLTGTFERLMTALALNICILGALCADHLLFSLLGFAGIFVISLSESNASRAVKRRSIGALTVLAAVELIGIVGLFLLYSENPTDGFGYRHIADASALSSVGLAMMTLSTLARASCVPFLLICESLCAKGSRRNTDFAILLWAMTSASLRLYELNVNVEIAGDYLQMMTFACGVATVLFCFVRVAKRNNLRMDLVWIQTGVFMVLVSGGGMTADISLFLVSVSAPAAAAAYAKQISLIGDNSYIIPLAGKAALAAMPPTATFFAFTVLLWKGSTAYASGSGMWNIIPFMFLFSVAAATIELSRDLISLRNNGNRGFVELKDFKSIDELLLGSFPFFICIFPQIMNPYIERTLNIAVSLSHGWTFICVITISLFLLIIFKTARDEKLKPKTFSCLEEEKVASFAIRKSIYVDGKQAAADEGKMKNAYTLKAAAFYLISFWWILVFAYLASR